MIKKWRRGEKDRRDRDITEQRNIWKEKKIQVIMIKYKLAEYTHYTFNSGYMIKKWRRRREG